MSKVPADRGYWNAIFAVRHPMRRRASWFFGCIALCVASAAAARPPNILIVVVDTLRADRVGAYGGPPGLTPVLDRLARQGTVFANAYAPSSWTCPSVASLLTSRYPSQHGVVSFETRFSDGETTLAERLVPARFGRIGAFVRGEYLAAGFSANFRIMRSLGYAQGFRTWYSYVT